MFSTREKLDSRFSNATNWGLSAPKLSRGSVEMEINCNPQELTPATTRVAKITIQRKRNIKVAK